MDGAESSCRRSGSVYRSGMLAVMGSKHGIYFIYGLIQ